MYTNQQETYVRPYHLHHCYHIHYYNIYLIKNFLSKIYYQYQFPKAIIETIYLQLIILNFYGGYIQGLEEGLNYFCFIKESEYRAVHMNIEVKSKFLQKKKQQRKKTQDQIESKSRIFMVQKNIRAYLARHRILQQSYRENNVQMVVYMGSDIAKFQESNIEDNVRKILTQPEPRRSGALRKFILSCMRSQKVGLIELAFRLLMENEKEVQLLCGTKEYVVELTRLLRKNYGYSFLNLSWQSLLKNPSLQTIPFQFLFDCLLPEPTKMQAEEPLLQNLNPSTTISILDYLNSKKNVRGVLNMEQFARLGAVLARCLGEYEPDKMDDKIGGFAFGVELLRATLKKGFDATVVELTQKDKMKNLMSLIQDQQELQYLENKLRLEPEFEQFCQITLQTFQKLFHSPKSLQSLMMKSPKFRQVLASLINEIKFIYDDRKILFIYHFLSDQTSLKQMSKQMKIEFYSALNIRMMTMDDEEFLEFNLFDEKLWRQIIQVAIAKAFQITKRLLVMGTKKQPINIKARLFHRDDQIQAELKILSQLLSNLNKKCLRTSKLPNQYFINQDLDNFLNTFKFGVGARAIQLMLKNFPFTFRFESRIKKLKQFIKLDKLNHDRSLFLQEEVDPDLVIAVRRGHQFLDAFDACFHKDLRRKYKIIFFNEQGLEEQGIDGGGIIKQFINRVLKSSFGDMYGMFYQTPQNEILPNPESAMTKQYQFVGKIVGKAVYESINIDQKFAQPFLNLLIGRQNSFEDLQYIDKQIYKSMVEIRRMSNYELEALQQTFTIMDVTPFGEKRMVNLKNFSNKNASKGPEVVVDSENKVQFVMSYADFKCNKQLQQKTRLFRKGFLTVMKSEWLTMFSNQQLNLIISGSNPNYSIHELKNSIVYKDYTQKSQTIIELWSILSQFTPQQKSAFLFYVTSCSRPPTMGFAAMKPLICIQKSNQVTYLPTANTCMNVLRLPDYKDKQVLRQKLLYAINAKAGFQFA